MYCPSDECPDFLAHRIRGDYREGLVRCPRCGTRLLPGSPPSSGHPGLEDGCLEGDLSGGPLLGIASFPTEHDANLAVSFLNAQGISASVSGDDCGRTDPVLGFVTGGIRVMVPMSQAQEAVDLLEQAGPRYEVGGV